MTAEATGTGAGPDISSGRLDNRQLSENLYDLYLIGLYEAVDPDILDVNELEQLLHAAE